MLNDIFHAPGFLGTNGNFLADLGLTLMILVGILWTVGAYLARKGRYGEHMWVQTAGVIVNWILVLWLMIGPFIGEVIIEYGDPAYPPGFYWVPMVHATIGFIAFVFGTFVTLRGHGLVPKKLRFKNYKPFMRAAYALYMLAILAGITVYLMWFVISPLPPVFE